MSGKLLPNTHCLALAAALVVVGLPVVCHSQTTRTTLLPPDPARIERLRSHGIEPDAAVLLRFLRQGFPPGTRLRSLPARPALKTQIVIDAIVELSRQQAAAAAPVFARLAQEELTTGIKTIVRWDVGQQRQESRATFETGLRRTIRRDAIVGLGLVDTAEAVYTLYMVFKQLDSTDLKIPCALALATVGSRAGIPYLVREIARANRASSVDAATAMAFITGRNYGPGRDDPIARREQAAKNWKNWLAREGKTFQPNRADILARRATPPIQPNPRQPKTVHDLLDCIAYPNDARWTIDPYEAHQRLQEMGAAVLDVLAKIVSDKQANLRIRREAIVQYTHLSTFLARDPSSGSDRLKRAYRLMRKLRWDRNPEIREVAAECARRLRERR